MNIDGHTRIYGLIGNPVGHTASPVIHNTLAELYGHNLVYGAFPVAQDLKKAVEGAYALGIGGLNVTVPYKVEVIPFLASVDAEAAKIGAVNTLVRTEGGYRGYNTDLPGLYRAMQDDRVALTGEQVIVLGAGGVARSAAMLAASRGAAAVYLLNRTLAKAEEVAGEVAALYPACRLQAMELKDYPELAGQKYLCIQATNVGMSPETDRAVLEDRDFYALVHTGYDLIFRPPETRFMKLVREAGGRSYNGLKMLLYQGIIAYELWNGVDVSGEHAAAVYRRMKEAMGLEA